MEYKGINVHKSNQHFNIIIPGLVTLADKMFVCPKPRDKAICNLKIDFSLLLAF